MRYISPALYARVLIESAHGKLGTNVRESTVSRFVAVVKRNGDSRIFPAIIFACENVLRKKAGKKLLTVETARKLEKHSLELIKRSFREEHTDIEEKINPELVAGVRFTENGERQLDGSLAHMLGQIFLT
jgi:F0F1-type ATP synthase delta subunit